MSDLPRKFTAGQAIPPQSFNFPIKFLQKGDPQPRKLYAFGPAGEEAKIPENGVKIAPEITELPLKNNASRIPHYAYQTTL